MARYPKKVICERQKRRRIKAIVDYLNLESSFDLSDEEESDRESNVNDPHSEKERQFNDLVTFTHDSDFIEEVSVSLDNSDHASDFSAESDSYGDKSEDEDNFWEDVDVLDDPFTKRKNPVKKGSKERCAKSLPIGQPLVISREHKLLIY